MKSTDARADQMLSVLVPGRMIIGSKPGHLSGILSPIPILIRVPPQRIYERDRHRAPIQLQRSASAPDDKLPQPRPSRTSLPSERSR
jgi:hypothetical protein